jgi:hypothetical protein
LNAPWLTLAQALSASSGGDTIIVRPGTYQGEGYRNLEPKSGTAQRFTRVMGAPGETVPVIDAQCAAGTQDGVFRMGWVANPEYIRISRLVLKGGGGAEGGTITLGHQSRCSNIIIEDCEVCGTNVGGVLNYNPADIRISYNGEVDGAVVRRCRLHGADAAGFKINGTGARNLTIANNEVYDASMGIAVKWGDNYDRNINIYGNIVRNAGEYGIWTNQGHVRVEHNLVYGVNGVGIFLKSDYSNPGFRSGFLVKHNTVHNCQGGIVLVERGERSVISDNIISMCVVPATGSTNIVLLPYETPFVTYNSIHHNINFDPSRNDLWREFRATYTLAQWMVRYPSDVGSSTADPLFEDPSTGDFHLRPGSPCRSAGSDNTDIGADLTRVGIQAAAVARVPQRPRGLRVR